MTRLLRILYSLGGQVWTGRRDLLPDAAWRKITRNYPRMNCIAHTRQQLASTNLFSRMFRIGGCVITQTSRYKMLQHAVVMTRQHRLTATHDHVVLTRILFLLLLYREKLPEHVRHNVTIWWLRLFCIALKRANSPKPVCYLNKERHFMMFECLSLCFSNYIQTTTHPFLFCPHTSLEWPKPDYHRLWKPRTNLQL